MLNICEYFVFFKIKCCCVFFLINISLKNILFKFYTYRDIVFIRIFILIGKSLFHYLNNQNTLKNTYEIILS